MVRGRCQDRPGGEKKSRELGRAKRRQWDSKIVARRERKNYQILAWMDPGAARGQKRK